MNTGQIRKAYYQNQEVYFHHWVKKVPDYELKEEVTKAVIEYADGTIEEVWAERIQFIDTPDEDKRAHLRRVGWNNDPDFTGYFHQWITKKDSVGTEYVVALIEDVNGDMVQVEVTGGLVQFLN